MKIWIQGKKKWLFALGIYIAVGNFNNFLLNVKSQEHAIVQPSLLEDSSLSMELNLYGLDASCVKYTSPPETIPSFKHKYFTRNGKIPVKNHYVDDSFEGKGSHFIFSENDINFRIRYWKTYFQTKIKRRDRAVVDNVEIVAEAIFDMRDTLQKMKNIAVIGSNEPWLQSMLVAIGVKHVTTFEYNKLTYEHPALNHTITYSSMHEVITDVGSLCLERSTTWLGFDAAFSISSFDHDGLGRYNDPICADADIISMRLTKKLLRKKGLLFLSLPIGEDVVVWNSYRRYGKIRLPLMTWGWKYVARYGWIEKKISERELRLPSYEPLFVLENLP